MQSNYTHWIPPVLTRLERTIVLGLVERAQFAHNSKIYQEGRFKELRQLDFKGSWLGWFLAEIEAFHGTFVRPKPTRNYGSAATLDVEVLQVISKRVHHGTPTLLFPRSRVL